MGKIMHMPLEESIKVDEPHAAGSLKLIHYQSNNPNLCLVYLQTKRYIFSEKYYMARNRFFFGKVHNGSIFRLISVVWLRWYTYVYLIRREIYS